MTRREIAEKLAWGVSGMKGSIDGDIDRIESALQKYGQELTDEYIKALGNLSTPYHTVSVKPDNQFAYHKGAVAARKESIQKIQAKWEEMK